MTEEEILARAKVLYDYERKVGWDPAWVNASPETRAWYEQAAREGN